MDAHTVCPTIALGRREAAAVKGTLEGGRTRLNRRMITLACLALKVVLQGLFFNEDLVAPLALALAALVMLVHMHTHGGLIRRCIIVAFGADV